MPSNRNALIVLGAALAIVGYAAVASALSTLNPSLFGGCFGMLQALTPSFHPSMGSCPPVGSGSAPGGQSGGQGGAGGGSGGGAGGNGAAALEAGRRYLGCGYVFGGSSCSPGIDCSGLTMQAYRALGIVLPHHAASQLALAHTKGWGVSGDVGRHTAGALLFFVTDGTKAEPGHVALAIGDGANMLSSNHPGDGPRVQPMFSVGYIGAAVPR